MDQTTIKTLYVFVEIGIDSLHLSQTIRLNFPDTREIFQSALLDPTHSQVMSGNKIYVSDRIEPPAIEYKSVEMEVEAVNTPAGVAPTKLALVSTIQFVAALQRLKEDLSADADGNGPHIAGQFWSGRFDVTIPRSKPLSPGEILGCTAPKLGDVDALMYVILACHWNNRSLEP
jgi:2-(3-amino-3-carboxypropyl)histidine synthase